MTAKNGDTVTVHYTGTLADGTVFDTSVGGQPLTFALGKGQIIPGFEEGLIGMSVGEKKSVMIAAVNAYGPHLDEMIVTVERTAFPQEIVPEVGLELEMQNQEGEALPVRITGVTDTSITLDANHPLAGKDLKFDIELIEIKPSGLIIAP